MEVMIAVAILSMTLIAVLSLSTSSFKITDSLHKKESMLLPITTVALHATADQSGTSRSLYSFLQNSYKIDNDSLKNHLNSIEFLYTQNELEIIDLVPDGVESSVMPRIRVLEHSIKSSDQSSRVYSIKVER